MCLFIGAFMCVQTGFAKPPKLPFDYKTCGTEEIRAAKLLAADVLALGKTDPAAALKKAEYVALNRSKCFQVAFGAALDGTGTAAINTSDTEPVDDNANGTDNQGSGSLFKPSLGN